MKRSYWIWGVCAVLFWSGEVGGAESIRFPVVEDEAQRVVIVANSNDPESIELARFYADRRSIPRENIVGLDLPAGEEIDWHQYVERLHNPLQTWLIKNHWMEAIKMEMLDDVGRPKVSTAGHRISYLVTCRGVPLKIRRTAGVLPDAPASLGDKVSRHNAAVDSELACINIDSPMKDGFLRNPLFGKSEVGLFGGDSVVRVSRLDGPTYPAVRRLVESAIEAEKRGLIGRAMIDIGGPHAKGDQWFEDTAKVVAAHGWNPQIDRARKTFKSSDRADAVAIYLGWYNGNIDGPFALPRYQFAPGAIALHLHSYSAKTLRLQNGGGWTGPLVARGVAGTVGNVYEPYMEYTHYPHMFIAALLAGSTLGEAAFFSMPVLSWQAIVVGDPLYRPATVPMTEQLASIDTMSKRWASYLVLRQLETSAEENEGPAQQMQLATRAYRKFPSLALALQVARMKAENQDMAGARNTLGMAAFLRRVRPDEWGLLAEVAQQFSAWEDAATAVKIWNALLRQELPETLRVHWLAAAIETADKAGDFSDKVSWESELRTLTAKPLK